MPEKYFRLALAILTLCALSISSGRAHAATDLKLNPGLNYSSDSDDGPLITGKNMSDGTLTAGKPAYIIFYHRECYNSKRQAKRTVALYEKYKDRVDFIIIDLDSPRSPEQSALVSRHYRRYIPHVTVYDKGGKTVYDRSGEVGNAVMTDLLDGLISGQSG